MDRRGGCCIARYTNDSKMDLIMQRFRPIAPKPTPSGGTSPPVERSGSLGCMKTGRGRKKCGTRKRKLSATTAVQDSTVVTLPLLPETPDLLAEAIKPGQKNSLPVCKKETLAGMLPRGESAVVWASVMVERVTATWGEEEGLGMLTDEEKMRRLEEDTCPGFLSDGWNRVWWTNRAFRELARETASFGEVDEDDVVVWVVMREMEVPVTCYAYTCRVRVQSTWKGGEDHGCVASSSVTLPCDVWRMTSGGFAWRLDVNAALRLGR